MDKELIHIIYVKFECNRLMSFADKKRPSIQTWSLAKK